MNIRTWFLGWLLLLSFVQARAGGENIDSCLMKYPPEQRYKGAQLEQFVKHIKGTRAISFRELLANWKQLSFTPEEQQRLVNKVEENITRELCVYCMQNTPAVEPDYRAFRDSLIVSEIPVSPVVLHNLKYVALWQKQDIEGIIAQTRYLKETGLKVGKVQDWMIMGKMLNYILEKSDRKQTETTLNILNEILKQREKENLMTIRKIRDNFEGKIMMIDLGEE